MTKIRLNSAQWTVLSSPVYHIATRDLMDMLHKDLEGLRDSLLMAHQRFKNVLPKETDIHSGRITRGMNHEKCPYIVLDYPRLINNGSFLLFRTLFWLGHNFSLSVVGSTEFLDMFLKLRGCLPKNWYVVVGKEEIWSNDPQKYTPIKELGDVTGNWRIARFFGYDKFPRWKRLVKESFEQIINALCK